MIQTRASLNCSRPHSETTAQDDRALFSLDKKQLEDASTSHAEWETGDETDGNNKKGDHRDKTPRTGAKDGREGAKQLTFVTGIVKRQR